MKIMKNKLWILFILCISALPIFAQQNIAVGDLPTITVTGTAEIQVVPDTATISFVVSEQNASVAAAKKANDATIAKVTDLAKRFGIAATDVKTDYIRVSEVTRKVKIPNSDDDYEEVHEGFRVSRSLVIKLKEIGNFESFLTALIDAGINDVDNVVFSSSELRKYKDQARAQAIRAAREKADALAKEIGQSIGSAVSISEENIDGYRSPYANVTQNNFSLAENSNAPTADAVGAISIKAQIDVKFLLK